MPETLHFSNGEKLDALGRALPGLGVSPGANIARILSYVVTEDIEGRGDQIKAVTIGQDVLGRGADFDPASDSIVRVEVKRLREALDHYYRTTGAGDPVRIAIPKGAYRPVFEPGAEADTAPPAPPAEYEMPEGRRPLAWVVLPALLVMVAIVAGGFWAHRLWEAADRERGRGEPFLALIAGANAQPTELAVARNLLARFETFRFFTGMSPGDAERERADYMLTLDRQAGAVSAVMQHRSTGEVIASSDFGPDTLGDPAFADVATPFRIWIARQVARNGAVEHDYAERGEYYGDFRCSVLTSAYFADQTDARHLAARSCIEDRLAQGIQSARLYSELAMLLREEHTDRRNPRPGRVLDRAADLARAAISIAPFDATAHYTLMTVLFVAGSQSEALAAGEMAIDLLPFDGELLGGFGARLNAMGQHRRALELFDRSRLLSPGAAAWRDYGSFLAHFGLGETAAAADSAMALVGRTNPLYLAALAIGYQDRGDGAAARQALARLEAAEPDIADMYRRRHYTPDLTRRLMTALDAVRS